MNEEYYEEWKKDNHSWILEQFAIDKNYSLDKDTLIEMEDDFYDEIQDFTMKLFNESEDIRETNQSVTNQLYRGTF